MTNKKKQTVLVVDDSEPNIFILKGALEDDYNIKVASDGENALRSIEESRPDLILLDIMMPGMDGLEVCARLKNNEKTGNIPIIFITAKSETEDVIKGFQSGGVDYIAKPFKPVEVKARVKTHLALQSTRRQLKDQNVILADKVKEVEVINDELQLEIARRKQLEQTAKLAAVGKLAAGIAHEINNPLSFIYANLENLNKFFVKIRSLIDCYDELDISEETKKAIEEKKEEINYTYLKARITGMIEKSIVGADRMKKIVTDMKTFARVDRAEVEEANINESIETTLGILIHEYKERIEIKKEYDEQLPPVKCFIAKLNQVFLNLLVNACQAIDGKGVITIRTGTEAGNIVIKIEDDGSGMPDDVKDKIFNPFFTTKPVGQGTGLGLSICHEIIQQHKGELSVKSEMGKGSVFTIKIPICQDLVKTDSQ